MRQHADSERLTRAVARCRSRAIPWTGTLYRSASPAYATRRDLVSGAGSRTAGGRWNPPDSFDTVYASLDVETAISEALAHFRHFGLPISSAMPRMLVALEARLQQVLDLTDGTVRHALACSKWRMRSEPWREEQERGREALTQAIGRVAWAAGLEGLLVPSGPCPGGKNLVLFPENFSRAGTRLRIVNARQLPGS